MLPKNKRLIFIIISMLFFAFGIGIILFVLNDQLVFFYTPSEIKSETIQEKRNLRIGGVVAEGSFTRDTTNNLKIFQITDYTKNVKVYYEGILPDLFREGQGVVVEGVFNKEGTFIAHQVLAKHDENYMPASVVDAIKKSGHWHENKNLSN
ncbi:MAG: cytochrome c maturation protein CcmE [Alphaproteobacteria bacterium]|nr:cytochrome c maturation protein CcmE [Alphaproteobacteria bacterium]